ncbi:hypothetical protein C922_05452 [Plasmodium inui San Antonio 1]|uniref:Uncharacterized protein n=1 Tax=Plasmodium inui San Antonio 1 TaxID=1237626 RepID=W7AFU6_9APIC|nr:hypothetical protein C922_05452 [Plasmodium inui San Antonio 1]EUD64171.1 hypothetical protein C922_05452 [Plasmodium inui San Antonio 1]
MKKRTTPESNLKAWNKEKVRDKKQLPKVTDDKPKANDPLRRRQIQDNKHTNKKTQE